MITQQQAIHRRAFTLIELLVVISIIGLLAALIIPLSGIATTKMRIARVKAELNNFVTAIETYKLEVGQYPPDHGELRLLNAADSRYLSNAAVNPLFYELTGVIFTNKEFRTVQGNEALTKADLEVFKRDGIRNSARDKFDVPYKGFSVKESQYAELDRPGTDIEILTVPVPGPFMLQSRKGKVNPWFYDASSTNRHNRTGFDLWADISIGKTNMVIGNWKN